MISHSEFEICLLILMPVMDIRHMSMLMLDEGMLMFMGMSNLRLIMSVKLVMLMSMFMDNGHMDMEMGVFLIRQQ